MKKLLLLLIFVISVFMVKAQVSNVAEFRIADATTAFGKNLPVGTKVYNVATNQYWVATAAVSSASTLTTASGSFSQLNAAGSPQNLSYNSGTHAVDIDGGGTSATLPLAVDDGATEGLASFTANDFDITSGNVSIDYTNGQAATNSVPGFATAAQITKLEGIATGAEVNLTMSTETFEEDDGTPTGHTLAHTAVTAQGCRVSLNGATLDPADYTLSSTTITLDGPVYQYDQVTITYFY